MKKIICLISLLVIFAFVLTACNLPNDSEDNGQNSTDNSITDSEDNENDDANIDDTNGNDTNGDDVENPDDNENDKQPGNDHTHTFGEWTVLTEATCAGEGVKERSCECGEKETEAIPTNDSHSIVELTEEAIDNGYWGVVSNENISPCLREVICYPICQNGCGMDFSTDNLIVFKTAEGHSFGDYILTNMPTESEYGLAYRKCIICHDDFPVYAEYIDLPTLNDIDYTISILSSDTALYIHNYTGISFEVKIDIEDDEDDNTECDHDWDPCSEPVLNNCGIPTCTASIIEIVKCMYCDAIKVDKILPPAGHNFGEWEVEKIQNADIVMLSRSCTVCGELDIVYDTPTHSVEYKIITHPTFESDGLAHYYCYHCDIDGNMVLPKIDIGVNSCIVEQGNCKNPNDTYLYTIISTEYNITVEYKFEVENENNCHDQAPNKENCTVIESEGHIYYVYICSKCNESIIAYVEAIKHNIEYKITTTPTYFSTGVITFYCNCGNFSVEAELPDLTDNMYSIVRLGDCLNPFDKYTCTMVIDDTPILIELNVAGNDHDASPAVDDCYKVELPEMYYYIYQCTKCANYIVAYYEYK